MGWAEPAGSKNVSVGPQAPARSMRDGGEAPRVPSHPRGCPSLAPAGQTLIAAHTGKAELLSYLKVGLIRTQSLDVCDLSSRVRCR